MPNPNRKSGRAKHPQSTGERLANALAKLKKAELIDLFVLMAEDDCAVMRWLELELGVDKSSGEIVANTRRAIAAATDFDVRDCNRNFDYDNASYETVERNFGILIDSDHLVAAMAMAGDLMEQGSYQVEMSDEGMMTEEIERCLKIVIRALNKKGARPPTEVAEWCAAMIEKDRVGFICDAELRNLRDCFEG